MMGKTFTRIMNIVATNLKAAAVRSSGLERDQKVGGAGRHPADGAGNRTNFEDGNKAGFAEENREGSGTGNAANSQNRSSIRDMYLTHQRRPEGCGDPDCKQESRGCDHVCVKRLEKSDECRAEDEIHNPAGMQRFFKCDRSGEL